MNASLTLRHRILVCGVLIYGCFFSNKGAAQAIATAPAIGADTTICEGSTIVLHAGAGYAHYAWSNGDTTESISVGAGTYSVTVTEIVRPGLDTEASALALPDSFKGPRDTTASAFATLNTTTGTRDTTTGAFSTINTTGYNDTTASVLAARAVFSIRYATSNTITIKERPLPLLSGNASMIDCRNVSGTITLQASGGSGAYTYEMDGTLHSEKDPAFPGLAPGTYKCRAIDSMGCASAPAFFSVTGHPERTLKASAIASGVHCPGAADGAIRVSIDLGNPPFTFALDAQPAKTSNVFSHVFPGPHTVIVQTDFCSDTLQVMIADIAPLRFTPAVADETAVHNGSITLHPSGGSEPYTVSWDQSTLKTNTLQHLPADTYTVHLSDNYGCQADTSIRVNSKIPVLAEKPVEGNTKKKKGRNAGAH